MKLAWVARAEPLAPRAVAGRGPIARALARRLLALDDERLGALRGVAGKDLLVAIGEPDALPWIDGVVYLGVDPAVPSLLLPTALTPTFPTLLYERALLASEIGPPPIAVLPEPPLVAPIGAARPIARAELEAWLRSEG